MIRERNVSSSLARRAFTLIELLTVIAIIAILAAILFPVFASAKTSAKTAATAASLRQIGTAANLYLSDYDDGTVLPQWGDLDRDHLWAVTLQPYLKSRAIFFDPSRAGHDSDTVTLSSGSVQKWATVTNLSLNAEGYSTWIETTNGTCTGKRTQGFVYSNSYHYGRNYAAMEEPEKRVAFAPSVWAGNDVGWHFFRSYAASWPNPMPATSFSWNNEVFDTTPLYAGKAIPVVHADGSVGKLRRSDFKTTDEAPDLVSYCAWMNDQGKRVWGPYWSSN